MFRQTNIRSSRTSRLWQATVLACAASGCGRHFDLGEITQSLGEDGAGTATASPRSLDGTVVFGSLDDIDVVVTNALVRPAPTTDILPIALGDVDGDGLGDWIQGDTLFYGAPRPDAGELEVGGRTHFSFGGSGTFRAAGDVNGDGLNDILFGVEQTVWIASWEREPVREFPVEQPPARLVLGQRERLGDDVDLAAIGLPFGDRDVLVDRFADRFASDLSDSFARQETQLVPLGDVDADGFADFASTTTVIYTRYLTDEYGSIGLGGQDLVRESVSYVHHGGREVLEIAVPRARLDADVRWSSGGDIDGDGFDDVIWTSPDAFYLLAGNVAAAGGELDLAHASEVLGVTPSFGETQDVQTGALGDLDGDGFDDFALNGQMVISSPTEGSLPWYLLYGGPHLLDGDFDGARASAVFETRLFSFIRSAGDWDDDGFSDLVLTQSLWQPEDEPANVEPSAREAILLRGGPARFSGSYLIPQSRLDLEPYPALINLVPTPAGDLDGDGFADLFVKRLLEHGIDLGIIYGGPLPLPIVH